MSFVRIFGLFLGFLILIPSFLGAKTGQNGAQGSDLFLFKRTVPLMPGLRLNAQKSTHSGVMDEQIIQAEGPDTITEQEIFDYYKKHLTNQGWIIEEPGTYSKNSESLTIELSTKGQFLRVHFHYHQKTPTP